MAQKKKTSTGKTRWIERYRDPAGKEHSKSFDTQREAKAWKEEQLRAIRRGEWLDPAHDKTTVADLVRIRIEESENPGTRGARETLLRNLGDLENMPVRRVQPSHIRTWIKTLTEGRPWRDNRPVSWQTISTCAGLLHGVFTQAIIDDLIVRHPMRGIKISSDKRTVEREDIPTAKDIAALIETTNSTHVGAAENPQLGRMISLAALTGLRGGEISGLRRSSVNMLRREIEVREQVHQRTREYSLLKTAKSRRTLPLSDEALKVVDAQLRECPGGPSAPLFQTAAGRPYTSGMIGQQFRAAAKRAGVKTTFHGLRHFYASRLIQSGVSVAVVQRMLGHSNPMTTLTVYTHLWPEANDEVRDALRDFCGIFDGDEQSHESA